jgi:transcriptional regulator with XRE-family HTH domain
MKEKTTGERIRAIRGDRSQADFGEEVLGSSQGAVSAWERDDKDRAPSAAIYFRLAALAPDPEDARFFLKQAGLTPEAVISLADSLLGKERNAFIVPPYDEAQRLPFPVSVSASLISKQSATFYVVAGKGHPTAHAGTGVAPGEIIVFEKCPPRYEDYIGEKVVAEFKDGLFVGRIGSSADEWGRYLMIGPPDVFPRGFHAGHGRIISVFGDIHPMGLEHRKLHEVTGIFGIWIAQFGTGAHDFWKKAAGIHMPKK